MNPVLTCQSCGESFETIRDAAAHEDNAAPLSSCNPNSEGYIIELSGD